MWLRQLLSSLKDFPLSEPTIIYEDNQSTICMAKNNQSHGRSKHVDIKFHFVREQVEQQTIKVTYCKSEEMNADIFTKGILNNQFKRLRTKLGMASLIQEECWKRKNIELHLRRSVGIQTRLMFIWRHISTHLLTSLCFELYYCNVFILISLRNAM